MTSVTEGTFENDSTDTADRQSELSGDCVAMLSSNQLVTAILLLTELGCYTRLNGQWQNLDPDSRDGNWGDSYIHDIDGNAVGDLLPLWDSAQQSGGTMSLSDII